MSKIWDVLIVGSGNAALCAGIAACERGAQVLIIERSGADLVGGNTKYTAGAMRFAYNSSQELLPLISTPDDPRILRTNFGSYTQDEFRKDLLSFNDGDLITPEQEILVTQSYDTMIWLAQHGVTYEPIWARQSFEKNGKIVFWGGLTLAAENEGVGLFEMAAAAFKQLGGKMQLNCEFDSLLTKSGTIKGIKLTSGLEIKSRSVVLACGGFESSESMRGEFLGSVWRQAKVRGTPNNTGTGLRAAWNAGAQRYGRFDRCHATPMDYFMKDYGNLNIPHSERKNYRKISYFLGVMLNEKGCRFVDEGSNFRNYTYAQFGSAILHQTGQRAWQIFDSKVFDLLYAEYKFFDANFEEANTLEVLFEKCHGINVPQALQTIEEFNCNATHQSSFDPTIKDGVNSYSNGLKKSNWAQILDTPPFRAYPVTGGITFSYGGLKVSENASVLDARNNEIPGLYACGEIVGGVFLGGYPGGSGLTSGAVFGRLAGISASR